MTASIAYLDHAATTPMVPQALAAMAERLALLGNPSSQHAAGRAARKVVEESRESIASALGARPAEVVFVSGGTEANNVAIKGLYWSRHQKAPAMDRIVVSSIEHQAVLDPARWLAERHGGKVVELPVDGRGRVELDAYVAYLAHGDVALVSTMWANNEIGTVQPIAAMAALASAHGVPMHSDAVQATGHLALDFAESGLDAMSVTAHKLGGPVGIGALLLKRELMPAPLLHGGGQERDLRSGTVPVALIAGFAAAVEAAVARRDRDAVRLATLRSRLVEGILHIEPRAVVNGATNPAQRLPNVAHVTFPGCEGDALQMLLDAEGVCVSTGPACSAGVQRASHVLLATGRDNEAALGSLRFSLGHSSNDADIDHVLAVLPRALDRARVAKTVRNDW